MKKIRCTYLFALVKDFRLTTLALTVVNKDLSQLQRKRTGEDVNRNLNILL